MIYSGIHIKVRHKSHNVLPWSLAKNNMDKTLSQLWSLHHSQLVWSLAITIFSRSWYLGIQDFMCHLRLHLLTTACSLTLQQCGHPGSLLCKATLLTMTWAFRTAAACKVALLTTAWVSRTPMSWPAYVCQEPPTDQGSHLSTGLSAATPRIRLFKSKTVGYSGHVLSRNSSTHQHHGKTGFEMP